MCARVLARVRVCVCVCVCVCVRVRVFCAHDCMFVQLHIHNRWNVCIGPEVISLGLKSDWKKRIRCGGIVLGIESSVEPQFRHTPKHCNKDYAPRM